MVDITIIIPVYNEKESLKTLFGEIDAVMRKTKKSFEVLFIDDGSEDGTAQVLTRLSQENPDVIRVIRFRRNFGKSSALQCGFRKAAGDVMITMDADLQDNPEEIPLFLEKIEEGYDLVSGWKKRRLDGWDKKIPSRIYNAITSWITGVKLQDFNCGFKAYRRNVTKEIDVYGELHRYIPVLAGWRGFKITEVAVRHRARKHGQSKFGYGRFLAGFLDLGTAYYVTRFSKKPSRLFGFFGFLFFFSGLFINTHILIIKIMGGVVGSRFPYLMMGVLLTLAGMQLIFAGLMSELMVYFYHRYKREYSVEYEDSERSTGQARNKGFSGHHANTD